MTIERPPPLVTIVDPGHPGPLTDVLASAPRDRVRPSLVQAVSVGLVVVLLAGVGTVVGQRRDQQQADRATTSALAGVQLSLTANGLGNDAREVSLGYEVVNAGTSPVELVAARVTGSGWRVLVDLPQQLGSSATASLALLRPLTCTDPTPPAPTLSVTVRVLDRKRVVNVPVPIDSGRFVGAILGPVCGDLDAALALSNSSGTARRVGDLLQVDLVLLNTSVYPVTVTGMTAGNLAVRGPRQPVDVPARPPGPLDLEAGVTRVPLRVALLLGECLGDGQVVDSVIGQALQLELTVTGRGGAGSVFVPVAGLAGLYAQLVGQRCRAVRR